MPASIQRTPRTAHVAGPGTLLVASDLHGNLTDLERLVSIWQAEDSAVLFLLGDLFHGPHIDDPDKWDLEMSHLGDFYPDRSVDLFLAVEKLLDEHPATFASLLGNHDHAHVGGPVVGKFWPDEAGHMEEGMTFAERARLHAMLCRFPLFATTDCGVVLTHAAPPPWDFTLEEVDSLEYAGYENVSIHTMYRHDFLGAITWRRGIDPHETTAFLERVARETGRQATVVVHGHERVDEGFYAEPSLLNLSTSFGMAKANKTYLRLDLSRTYRSVEDLQIGRELLPLYD